MTKEEYDAIAENGTERLPNTIEQLKAELKRRAEERKAQKAEEMKAYKIKAWVARDEINTDESSRLFLYRQKPKRSITDGLWICDGRLSFIVIPDNMFPELTWDDEPKEVEVTIKEK